MPDQTSAATHGVALLTGEGPIALRVTHAGVPAADLPRVRDAVDRARAQAAAAPGGDQMVVIVAWGRHGRKPLLEVLDAPAPAVAELRGLLMEVDR